MPIRFLYSVRSTPSKAPCPVSRARLLCVLGLTVHLILGWAVSGCGTTGGPSADGNHDTGGDGDADASGGDGGSGGLGGQGAGGGASGGASGGDSGGDSGGNNSGGSNGEGSVGEACPGAQDPVESAACRETSECRGGQCVLNARDWGGVCGLCFAPIVQCVGDDECADDQICEPSPQRCECPGYPGPSTLCVAGCTQDSCPEDMVCGANLRCVPQSCDGGFSCPHPLDVCAPERSDADAHGCAPTLCDGAEDCEEQQVCAPERNGATKYGCAVAHCATDGTACATGFHCDPEVMSGGACVVDHCQDHTDCPVNQFCDPEVTGQGCVRKSCALDADCDCGYCIQGHCEDRLWVCEAPPPS